MEGDAVSKSAEEVSILQHEEVAILGSCHIRKVRTEAEEVRELPHIRITVTRAEHITICGARIEVKCRWRHKAEHVEHGVAGAHLDDRMIAV